MRLFSKIWFILFTAGLFLPHLSGYSQAGTLQITNYPPASYASPDYISSPQNFCVLQNREGVIFASNQAGILSFDGNVWQMVPGTAEKQMYKMALGRDGNIYTGGLEEMGYLARDSVGQFRFYSLTSFVPEKTLGFKRVFNVIAAPDASIFFMDSGWLFRWDGKQMTSWKSKKGFLRAFPTIQSTYFQSMEDGLWKYEGPEIHKIPFSDTLNTLLLKGVWEGNSDHGSTLKLITAKSGFFEFSDGVLNPIPTALDSLVIWNIQLLQDGKVAVATETRGLCLFNPIDLQVEYIDEAAGLYFNSILFPQTDRQGGIWVGADIGLSRIEYPPALRKVAPSKKPKILAQSMTIYQDQLFIGMIDGCWSMNPHGAAPDISKIPELVDRVTGMVHFRNGLIVGSGNQGVYEIVDESIRQIAIQPTLSISHSRFDSNRIWLGLDPGLTSLIFQPSGWVQEERISALNHPVYHIEELPDSSVWASLFTVSRVRFPDGRLGKPEIMTFDSTQGFTSDHGEFDLFQYNDQLYFGTNRGIFVYDEAKGQLIPTDAFGERFADRGNAAYYMTVDVLGQIWLYDGTRTGFLRKGSGGNWQWNDLPLRAMEDQQVWSIYAAPDSLIWIGTTTTLYCFDLRIPKTYLTPFHTLINKIIAQDSIVLGYSGSFFINDSTEFSVLHPPRIPYNDRNISFSFSATSYVIPEKNVFSHWLEGHEANWSPWTHETTHSYSDLPEGSYIFHIRSKNLYGVIGAESRYSFTILPPFYRTWWAYGIYVILFVGLLILLIQWRVRAANRKQDILRDLERKQQNALLRASVEGQERERERIAKELHDDIQVTLSIAKLKMSILHQKLLSEGREEVETSESSALMKDAISSVRAISSGLLPLSLQRFGLRSGLARLCETMDAGEVLKVEFSVEGDEKRFEFEKELGIFRIVQELSANTLKHSNASSIQLQLVFSPNSVQLSYSDNGKGFDPALLREADKGLGLKHIETRIMLMGGDFRIVSTPGEGSSFWLKIPM